MLLVDSWQYLKSIIRRVWYIEGGRRCSWLTFPRPALFYWCLRSCHGRYLHCDSTNLVVKSRRNRLTSLRLILPCAIFAKSNNFGDRLLLFGSLWLPCAEQLLSITWFLIHTAQVNPCAFLNPYFLITSFIHEAVKMDGNERR